MQTAKNDDQWVSLVQNIPARLAAVSEPTHDGANEQNISSRQLQQLTSTQLLQDNVDRLSTVQESIVAQV